MAFTRILKRYLIGEDVREVKDKLVSLGYLKKATHNMYGDDTFRAVKAFQAASGLEADGMVGPCTYAALFEDPKPVPVVDVPDWIAEPARTEIALALTTVSTKRREIVLKALRYCVDYNKSPSILRGFYIRGANVVDKDLTVHVMTEARLNSYFKKASYAPYYDSGRKEMMQRMAKQSGYTIVGADCSGFIVGLWRAAGVVSSGFDATADHLYGSYCVERKAADLLPGDLAHKSGHIALVASKNYIIESGGGAYGIQLNKRTDRRLMDFRDRTIHKMSKWQHYGDPKVY